ncbi:MAG TPA: GNAT family N-acetyltransferase [Polyangia bacterium]|nr:GNAT family N-acetyltransferase [Polyangia bacterium]
MQSGIAPAVVVRLAVPGDAPAMAGLHVRAWRAAYANVMPDAFLRGLNVEEREAMWRRSVTPPELAPAERVILVAEAAGVVLGFAAAGHARGDDEFGLGELYAINVDPPAWGQGAGRALLAAAAAWLDGRFATSILWVVDRNTRARALYERAGWSLDGATKTEDYGGAAVNNCRYRRASGR